MRIKKIVQIKNCGKFVNITPSNPEWNGELRKINTFYAPNGTGKTTFSIIFRSLNNDNELLLKKRTFNTTEKQYIKFIKDDNKELKFSNSKWNDFYSKIEVFNSLYLEDNLYTITMSTSNESTDIFSQNKAEKIQLINNQISELSHQLSKIRVQIKNKKNYIKHNKDKKVNNNLQEKEIQRDKIIDEIEKIKKEKFKVYQESINHYRDCINKYLEMFSPSISLTDTKVVTKGKNILNIIYGLKVDNYNISIEDRNKLSLKYVLSDGDKNALSLSFFLAKFDLLKNKNEYIVVIDDPFTSFDSQRKTTTINKLAKLADSVNQFYLLSHDMHFIFDFTNIIKENDLLNLKINCNNNNFYTYDIKTEMLTGLSKDLYTLRNYKSFSNDQLQLREVRRCIRPSIEGVFRLKYFQYITDTQWLGDFISLIRNSNETQPMHRLLPYIDELSEINDYSKGAHHSNPNYIEQDISPSELATYVKRTLKLIENL